MSRLESHLATIEGFRELKADWYDKGSEPISEKAIEAAKRFAAILNFESPQSSFAPCQNGGIGYEDEHWIIDIDPDGKINGEYCP